MAINIHGVRSSSVAEVCNFLLGEGEREQVATHAQPSAELKKEIGVLVVTAQPIEVTVEKFVRGDLTLDERLKKIDQIGEKVLQEIGRERETLHEVISFLANIWRETASIKEGLRSQLEVARQSSADMRAEMASLREILRSQLEVKEQPSLEQEGALKLMRALRSELAAERSLLNEWKSENEREKRFFFLVSLVMTFATCYLLTTKGSPHRL